MIAVLWELAIYAAVFGLLSALIYELYDGAKRRGFFDKD